MGQKRKNTQITVIRNRTEAITTDAIDIKRIKK